MLPKPLKDKLSQRLEKLLDEADKIQRTIRVQPGRTTGNDAWVASQRGHKQPDYEVFDHEGCLSWMTKCTTLLGQIIPRTNPNYVQLTRAFKDPTNANPHAFRNLTARLRGIGDDFDGGFLDDLALSIEASISGDYMGQAERLLAEGQSGKYDHVPAAVLAGAILEKALRSLCGRQTPPIPTAGADGRPKMLNSLIDDVKKADVYNETEAKHLRAWAGIRNHAAHGEFDDFDRNQVQGMITGVKRFLSEYC